MKLEWKKLTVDEFCAIFRDKWVANFILRSHLTDSRDSRIVRILSKQYYLALVRLEKTKKKSKLPKNLDELEAYLSRQTENIDLNLIEALDRLVEIIHCHRTGPPGDILLLVHLLPWLITASAAGEEIPISKDMSLSLQKQNVKLSERMQYSMHWMLQDLERLYYVIYSPQRNKNMENLKVYFEKKVQYSHQELLNMLKDKGYRWRREPQDPALLLTAKERKVKLNTLQKQIERFIEDYPEILLAAWEQRLIATLLPDPQ